MMFGKIVPRLLLVFLLLSPLPMAGLAYFFIGAFEQSLTRTVLSHLASIADKQLDQIDTYLDERLADTQFLVNSSTVQEALHELSTLFREEPVGSLRYRQAMDRYRDGFLRIMESRGYYDLLLIDKNGNVVFSILHEDDLGSNLNTGELHDSMLAAAQRNALALLDSQLTPAAPYEPSGGRPAFFIVTPLLMDGSPVGTLAVQLDLDKLISISGDNTGLGMTGETVLAQLEGDELVYVGPMRRISDATFRYRIPFGESPLPMRKAVLGDNGKGFSHDYAGIDVVAAWRYLPALGWGMVIKMDTGEAFDEVRKLRRISWAALAVLFVISAITALIFGRSLLLPIRRLTEAAGVIAGGDIERRVPVEGWSELKELAGSFNRMTDQMSENQMLLERRVVSRTADLEGVNSKLNELLTLHEAILDNAAHAIIAATPEGVITVFNRAAETMLGYSSDEMIGKQTIDIVHDRDELERRALELSKELGFAVQPGVDAIVIKSRCSLPNEHEWRYRNRDGGELSVWLSVAAMRDADQAISGYLGVAVDIGKIETIEQELLDSETRFRTIFEKAGIGIAFADSEGNLLQVNDTLAEMLECSAEKLLKCNFAQLTYPDDLPSELKAIEAIRQGRCDDYCMEKRYLTQTGRVIWGELAVSVIRDDRGNPINFVGMIVDITKRKESETEYRVILETTQDGFGMSDIQGRFVDVNDAYCRLTGYSKEELLQMSISDVDANEQEEDTRRHIENIIKYGEERFETKHRRKDGQLLDIEIGVNYLPVASGRLVFFLRDISARKEAEAALLEAKQNAEAANRAKSAFLANMSHEIRTPMNAILGLTQLVLETELNARQKDFLQKVQSSSKALLNILNDILDYSKIEAGRLEIERIPFRIEQVLMSVSDLFAAYIEEKGLELFFEIAPEVDAELLGDPLRLTQILNNLVSNAIKFTQRGEICIKVEIVEHFGDSVLLRFTVRDTGIGLSREHAKQLFQPFMQADSSITRQFGGTGLGLAICRRLVNLMNGSIEATGFEGKGATFTFTINAGISAGFAKSYDTSLFQARRVLVVDDQETSRTIIENLLIGWGLPVAIACSGEDALNAIHRADREGEPFSTVLLDWRMPGMTGLDVARQIDVDCREGRLKHPLTIVMVTAYDKEQLLAYKGLVRFERILTKPVIPSVLFDTLVDASQATESEARPANTESLDGLNILVAEDNVLNQQVVSEILTHRGASATVVANGKEALAMLEQAAFDLVLMDLQMPVMDGFEATPLIKALPYGRALPVIAMSAAVLSEERERCRVSGVDDFVVKPVDPKELSRVVLKWCDKPAARVHASLPALDEKIDREISLDLPGFDTDSTLRLLDGNSALLLRLLRGFAEMHENTPKHLEVLLLEKRYDEAAALLHNIKGLAANLGAQNLSRMAESLERKIVLGREPVSCADFCLQLKAATEFIANLPDPHENMQNEVEISDSASIVRLLCDLIPYLEEQELIPETLSEALSDLHCIGLAGARLKRLRSQLDHFDHSGALATIEDLLILLKQDEI